MSVSHNLPTRFAKVIWFGQEIPSCLEPVRLRAMASRIRDELDVQVAQNGPSSLEPEAVLAINKLLLLLKTYRIPQAVLRWTRIHLAIMEMCGKATRWPRTLVDEAESVVMRWENQFGRLKRIRPLLFDKGGRLHSVCLPEDLSRTVSVLIFTLRDSLTVIDVDREVSFDRSKVCRRYKSVSVWQYGVRGRKVPMSLSDEFNKHSILTYLAGGLAACSLFGMESLTAKALRVEFVLAKEALMQ